MNPPRTVARISEACREVWRQPDVARRPHRGIGYASEVQLFVPVTASIAPVRPAILWNDIRCAEEAEYARTTIGAEKVFSRHNRPYAPGQMTL